MSDTKYGFTPVLKLDLENSTKTAVQGSVSSSPWPDDDENARVSSLTSEPLTITSTGCTDNISSKWHLGGGGEGAVERTI